MISPISFTSTYKVNNDDKDAFDKFQGYAFESELEDGVTTFFKDGFEKKYPHGYKAEQILIAPDYNDKFIEAFLAFHNIKFTKYKTDELLDPKTIKSRIKKAPENFKTVEINARKLENFIKNQRSNIRHCEEDYNKYYKKPVNDILKSGDDFEASTLHVGCLDDKENLKTYVNRFGFNNLNGGQVSVDFLQKTDFPDHCIFSALKELGVENIPVYVDKDSYEIGKIIGLF